ncbi:MAG: FHA domain-containing protein [Mycobacterium sp.]|nr:FHA domain-containing protein [Mycobacterium sp.]
MTYESSTHRSDQVDGEITAAFAAGSPAELPDNHATALEFEQLPSGSAAIVVKRGPNAGSRFTLDRSSLSAGRHAASDIFLDDITVSRRHAEFRCENGRFRIVDVGSLNGIYVNRQPVDSATLTTGDEIQIGNFRLVFFADSKPANSDDEVRTL